MVNYSIFKVLKNHQIVVVRVVNLVLLSQCALENVSSNVSTNGIPPITGQKPVLVQNTVPVVSRVLSVSDFLTGHIIKRANYIPSPLCLARSARFAR